MDSRLRGNDSGGEHAVVALPFAFCALPFDLSFTPRRAVEPPHGRARNHVILAQAGIHTLPQTGHPQEAPYQFNRRENCIWREFSAELMLPKLDVPKMSPGRSKFGWLVRLKKSDRNTMPNRSFNRK